MSQTDPDRQPSDAEAADANAEHVADRPPTADEERDAEKGAAQVDLDKVGEHYEEMEKIGADVKGEGQID